MFSKKTLRFLRDNDLVEAALIGLWFRRSELESTIAYLKGTLGLIARREENAPVQPKRRRRRFSAAARKRMAEAQKRRWEKYRAAKKRK